jgi:LPXTG-site transpeptidase (sortase) family protein
MKHGSHAAGAPARAALEDELADVADVADVADMGGAADMPEGAVGAGAGNAGARGIGARGAGAASGAQGRRDVSRRRSGAGWQLLGIIAELLLTLAVLCGLYIAWQMWWTGVESERAQDQTRQSAAWSAPGNGGKLQIAKAQPGDPPVQPASANVGDLVAQVYIPRFGEQWNRNVVQGTDPVQLNKHGMGHYEQTQMPGQVGNIAIAGHRNGYGQPLGDIDKLEVGDPIILRTKDYWYVYRQTSYRIVLPTQGDVVAPNPENPFAPPTKRMITLTTCEPKYTTPTHRWISYGELDYWAKVSDGVPKELATTDASGAVKFTSNEQPSLAARLPSLQPVIAVTLTIYLVLFIAAAVAWRWPILRDIHQRRRRRPDISIYGTLLRWQPGVAPIRVLLLLLLLVAGIAALMQWAYPWAASTIPYLRAMSNYVTV